MVNWIQLFVNFVTEPKEKKTKLIKDFRHKFQVKINMSKLEYQPEQIETNITNYEGLPTLVIYTSDKNFVYSVRLRSNIDTNTLKKRYDEEENAVYVELEKIWGEKGKANIPEELIQNSIDQPPLFPKH